MTFDDAAFSSCRTRRESVTRRPRGVAHSTTERDDSRRVRPPSLTHSCADTQRRARSLSRSCRSARARACIHTAVRSTVYVRTYIRTYIIIYIYTVSTDALSLLSPLSGVTLIGIRRATGSTSSFVSRGSRDGVATRAYRRKGTH